VHRGTIFLGCDKLCGIPSPCSHVEICPACFCYNYHFLIQVWIHMTARGMQAFWYYLALALPRAIKAALMLTSSIPLNFGNPGFFNFPMQAYLFAFFRGSVPRCPSAALLSKCYSPQSAQFCQEGVSRDHEYMWSESGVSPAHL